MKVIYNKVIPFKGFKCVNLFGVLFVREGCTMRTEDYNHEAIHTAQMSAVLPAVRAGMAVALGTAARHEGSLPGNQLRAGSLRPPVRRGLPEDKKEV